MRIRDLGTLSGPVLLFGGPYSNLQATEAVISEARARGIAAQNCICTGDVVAYCADASATVAAIRAFGCPVVAGNMEHSLGAGATDCGCGFEDGTACDLLSRTWFAHASAQMSADDRVWMSQCPDWIVFTYSGRRYCVVHGAPSDVSRFMWPTMAQSEFEAEWASLNQHVGVIDAVISGHSGLDFQRQFAFGQWINAGVIGMPPHDGHPETRFAILDGDSVTVHRLSYDFKAAAHGMAARGLTQGYNDALLSGYWPSEDVLPPELCRSSRANG